jgi:hypothetical protein
MLQSICIDIELSNVCSELLGLELFCGLAAPSPSICLVQAKLSALLALYLLPLLPSLLQLGLMESMAIRALFAIATPTQREAVEGAWIARCGMLGTSNGQTWTVPLKRGTRRTVIELLRLLRLSMISCGHVITARALIAA